MRYTMHSKENNAYSITQALSDFFFMFPQMAETKNIIAPTRTNKAVNNYYMNTWDDSI